MSSLVDEFFDTNSWVMDVCAAANVANLDDGVRVVNESEVKAALAEGIAKLARDRSINRCTVNCFEFYRLPDDGIGVDMRVHVGGLLQVPSTEAS